MAQKEDDHRATTLAPAEYYAIGLAEIPDSPTNVGVRRLILATLFLGLLTRTSVAAVSEVGATHNGTICVDAATGAILSENKADWPGHPASVTKLMTMLLVLEDIQAGKASLYAPITITKASVGTGGSMVWLAAGETFTTEALLYALMLQSANDAAVALAIHRAGSTPAFVARMNTRAAQLGMTRTRFVTPNGLTYGKGPHDTTTARDLAKLSVVLCKMPAALKFTSAKTYTFRPGAKAVNLVNHNRLLSSFKGCDGLKTGWTVAADASMITTAREGDARVIAVVLGCDSPQGAKAAQRVRDQMAARLMAQGLARLALLEVEKAKLHALPARVAPVAAAPKSAQKGSKTAEEPGFFDWLGDLFSF